MPTYVKIFDVFSEKERVYTREVALNKLQHNHFDRGGRFCACNEAEYYLTLKPEPEVEEIEEYVPELPEATEADIAQMVQRIPEPEEVEALEDPEPKKTRSRSTKAKAKKAE